MNKKYKLAIADDNQLFALSLANSLTSLGNHEIYKTVKTLNELQLITYSSFFDLLILDVNFNGESALDFLKSINFEKKHFKILCLTSHNNAIIEQEAYELGVDYFASKDNNLNYIIELIDDLLNGKIASKITATKKFDVDGEVFTKRQIQVLKALRDFDSEIQVSKYLNISLAALKSHKQNLFVKTNTKNVSKLLLHAIDKGLILTKSSL